MKHAGKTSLLCVPRTSPCIAFPIRTSPVTGITADQFVILACLEEQDEVTQQDLVRRAASDPSTVRAMLVLMEGEG